MQQGQPNAPGAPASNTTQPVPAVPGAAPPVIAMPGAPVLPGVVNPAGGAPVQLNPVQQMQMQMFMQQRMMQMAMLQQQQGQQQQKQGAQPGPAPIMMRPMLPMMLPGMPMAMPGMAMMPNMAAIGTLPTPIGSLSAPIATKKAESVGDRTTARVAAQQAAAAAATQAAQAEAVADKKAVNALGRKRKQEARLPPLSTYWVPESAQCNQLQNSDRYIEQLIAAKKAEVQEAYCSATKGGYANPEAKGTATRTIRIWIRAEYHNQNNVSTAVEQQDGIQPSHELRQGITNTTLPLEATEPPGWTLSITGRILDLEKKEDKQAAQKQQQLQQQGQQQPPTPKDPPVPRLHFTHYLKYVNISLGSDTEYTPSEFKWQKHAHEGPHKDRIVFNALGSQPVEATITIQPDFAPQVYMVSEELASLLTAHGLKAGTRGLYTLHKITCAVFNRIASTEGGYIRAFSEEDDTSRVKLDAEMAKVLLGGEDDAANGDDKGAATEKLYDFNTLQPLINKHISLPEPLVLKFKVAPQQGLKESPCETIDISYECAIPVDIPWWPRWKEALDKELDPMDASVTAQIQRLNEFKRRHKLLTAFSIDPLQWLDEAVAAQGLEIRTSTGIDGEYYEVLTAGELYGDRWAEDAVLSYEKNQTAQKLARRQAIEARMRDQRKAAHQNKLVLEMKRKRDEEEAASAAATAQQQQQQQQPTAVSIGGVVPAAAPK